LGGSRSQRLEDRVDEVRREVLVVHMVVQSGSQSQSRRYRSF
jgi:hypothetical protein